jgi:hypothetical protein
VYSANTRQSVDLYLFVHKHQLPFVDTKIQKNTYIYRQNIPRNCLDLIDEFYYARNCLDLIDEFYYGYGRADFSPYRRHEEMPVAFR